MSNISMYPDVSLHSEEQENVEEEKVVDLPRPEPEQRIDNCMNRILRKYNERKINSIYAVTVDKEGNVDIQYGDMGMEIKNYMLVAACMDMIRQNIIRNATKDVLGINNG